MSYYNDLHAGNIPGTEEWSEIPGFPRYQASTNGLIKGKFGTILKTYVDRDGNHCVHIWNAKGIRKCHTVGRLILTTFVGPPPEGHVCCHGKGGRSDHSLANLSWGTQQKNAGDDKRRDGTIQTGEQNGKSKLTLAEVSKIKRLLKEGVPVKAIADLFNVSTGAIYPIKKGVNWNE